jgi:hypothetical protein
MPALQQAKALNEQIDPNTDSDNAPEDGTDILGGIQNKRNDDQVELDQGSVRLGRFMGHSLIEASGAGVSPAAENGATGLRW